MPPSSHRTPRSANDTRATDDATAIDLPVCGNVPPGLSGQYVRVGKGMVHAVNLTEGRAPSYRRRGIRTDATNVISYRTSILAFGDGTLACELGGDLDTLLDVDLAGSRRGLTAHAKVDSVTGELHLLTYSIDPSQLHVSVSPGGLTRTIRPLDGAPSRIRQLEPARDCVALLADGFVGVSNRAGRSADSRWFPVDTHWRHMATAHAQGETVIVHAIGPSLVRWTLHRRATTAHTHVIDATPHGFATSNGESRDAARRFLWTVGPDAVHKHDLITGTRRSHDVGAGRHPGQHVFVADPARSATEDGGWLVGLVHDVARHATDFVVLDAEAIEQPAVAVAPIPHRIHNGGHGAWISAERFRPVGL